MKQKYLPLLLLLGALLIGNSGKAQHKILLKDNWQFVREDLGSVWEAVRPAAPGSPEAVPLWQSVTLPHSFNERDAVDPDVNYYQGSGWYRTRIEIKNPYTQGRTLLHFKGAGQKTDVYVYQTKVGSHVGGYDEWTVDITEAVKKFRNSKQAKRFKGKIPIEIRCDNSRDVEMIPSDMVDFTVYGGLYRNVYLEYVPEVSLKYFHIKPEVDPHGKKGEITFSASFYQPKTPQKTKLEIQIIDPSGQKIQTQSKEITSHKELKKIDAISLKSPQLWSPENPKRYTAKVKLVTDEGVQKKEYQFGFRNFKFVKHGPFKLNGKRLLLKGTHRHQDWAGVGAAETEEMVRREFKMIKAMGANFIRLAHYQQSPLVLHLCDSLGLLVWEEIPWNRGGLGGKKYKLQAKRILTNMIMQHYNHPSVIVWSLGNEIDWPGDFPEYHKDSIRAFLSVLNHLAHQLDPGRKTGLRRCDFCRDILDVYSPSIWAGWYSGRYTEYKKASKKQMKRVNHFFHMEWGADALAGRHAEDPYKNIGGIPTGQGVAEKTGDAALVGGSARVSKDGDWSETYQCDLIDWYLKEQETMPWLTGTAYWIFKDFATPLRPNNPIPYVNTKGVVGRDLTPKNSYYVFQSYWANPLMAHIYGHTWPRRWGRPGKKELFRVYSNSDKAELFVNGKSYGMKKRHSQDFPAAGLHWKVPLYKGNYTVKVVAYRGKEKISDSIHFYYQTEEWGEPNHLKLSVQSISGDTTAVVAKMYDKKGIQCLNAQNIVRFSIAGGGRLLDDLGTSEGSRKVQMYNGRAIIKIKRNQGKSTVGVRAKEAESDLLRIE